MLSGDYRSFHIKITMMWLLHIILAIAGFFFVHGTIDDFFEKRTHFHKKIMPISGTDTPVITFCNSQPGESQTQPSTYIKLPKLRKGHSTLSWK